MSNERDFNIYASEGAAAGEALRNYVVYFIDAHNKGKDFKDDSFEMIFNAAIECFKTYYEHLLNLDYDKYGIPQEPPAEIPQACKQCLCETCTILYECNQYPKTDGITPPPCAACTAKECMQPHNKECAAYIPDDG